MTETTFPSDQRPAMHTVVTRPTARTRTGTSEIAHLSEQLQAIALRQQNKSALLAALFELQLQRASTVGCATLVPGQDNTMNLGPHRFRHSWLDDKEIRSWLVNEFRQPDGAGGLRVIRSRTKVQLAAIIAPLRVDEHAAWVTLVNLPEGDARLSTEIAITELVAAYARKWAEQRQAAELSRQLSATAAILELVRRIEYSENVTAACFTVANALQEHLRCERVVVGMKQGQHGCRVVAISGVAEVDDNADMTRKLKAVLDEAMVRDEVSAWPPLAGTTAHQLLAHKTLARRDASVISTPLKSPTGETVAALAVEGRREFAALPEAAHFVAALEEPLGSALQTAKRVQGGQLQRCWRGIMAAGNAQQRWLLGGLIVLAILALLFPTPYKIQCRCVIEPVQRRFCVAPHDGLLENTFAEPGDVVTNGHLLARMDGREIRWELAGISAEMHRAAKLSDTHRAHHEIPDALLAELEVKKLDSRSKLLRFREAKLAVTSPIEGVVLSGSLDRRENYPVSKGQVLYEIAPLDPLRIELGVPAAEVMHVEAGMPVRIRLDGFGDQVMPGKVDKIRPRSEVRDGDNVFVAEVTLDNPSGRMRPGMKGHGKIVSRKKSVGWIVFHRVGERLQTAWPW